MVKQARGPLASIKSQLKMPFESYFTSPCLQLLKKHKGHKCAFLSRTRSLQVPLQLLSNSQRSCSKQPKPYTRRGASRHTTPHHTILNRSGQSWGVHRACGRATRMQANWGHAAIGWQGASPMVTEGQLYYVTGSTPTPSCPDSHVQKGTGAWGS